MNRPAPSSGRAPVPSLPPILRGRVRPGWLVLGLLLPAFLAGGPSEAGAQASLLTPLGTNQAGLSGCDDCAAPVSLTGVFSNGVNFGGTIYTEVHISTNGYVTFGHGNSSYSPQGIAAYTQGPIIAPQYDDLDPSQGGNIHYHQNTASGYVLVTFEDVSPYASPHSGSGTNTLQMVMRRIGPEGSQDFQIEIRYHRLSWARSGNNSAWPTAGWSAGDQATYAEVPLSGQAGFRDLVSMSNVGESGVFRWNVEGGTVEATPTVNQTTAVTAITGTTATSGGNVSSDGGHPVTVRGLVWNTSSGPTLANASVEAGEGTGSFTATLTGLSAATTYFVRAYATNTLGTAYGPERQFTTPNVVPPSVNTDGASQVEATSARVSATVTSDGGGTVTGRGVAFGTSANPTTAGASVAAGSGTGGFTAELTGLDPITTYHARAYAVNASGISYGQEITFTTDRLGQTIDFGSLGTRVYGDAPGTVTATATSGLDVEITSGTRSIASISGNTLTIHSAGTVTLTATQAGSELYHPAPPVSRTVRVNPRPVTGHFTVEAQKVYDESDAAVLLETGLEGVLEQDRAYVSLAAEAARFGDPSVGAGREVVLVGATLQGPRANRYVLVETVPAQADILPAPPYAVTLSGPSSALAGEPSGTFRLTLRDRFGNETPSTGHATFRLDTDAETAAEFIHADARVMTDPSVTILPGASSVNFRYRNPTVGSGTHRITATRTSGPSLPGAGAAWQDLVVESLGWNRLVVEVVDAGADAMLEADGTFTVRVIAVDAHGNRVPGAIGAVTLQADGPLSIPSGMTTTFRDGVATFDGARFEGAGQFTLRAEARDVMGEAHAGESPAIVVHLPFPDVVLTVEADSRTVTPGQSVLFTVRAVNRGAGPAERLTLPSPLAGIDRIEILDVAPSVGTWDAGDGVWRIDSLAPGEEAVLRIHVRATAP